MKGSIITITGHDRKKWGKLPWKGKRIAVMPSGFLTGSSRPKQWEILDVDTQTQQNNKREEETLLKQDGFLISVVKRQELIKLQEAGP